MIKLVRPGEDRREAVIHLHYGLLAEILTELARSLAAHDPLDKQHRSELASFRRLSKKGRKADDMSFRRFRLLPIFCALFLAAVGPAHADAARGGQLARQWCANCHLVETNAARAVPQGPPSFREVAHSGMTADQLRAFLSHPHGAMPDFSLTRAEIDDLIGYIDTLR
jgi:cytochrome c